MHACPPISRVFSLLRRNVERTLRIELGVTRAPQEQEVGPQALAFPEPLGRGEEVPLPEVVVDRQVERVPALHGSQ